MTYGTFRPGPDGCDYPERPVVASDFAAMVQAGVNTLRTYTVPPRWLLDVAWEHGLWVMVGLPWEQHITFLDDPARVRSIEARVRGGVQTCAGHPAILAYAIGNEIPSSIVRWYGARRVERFLERLYTVAKQEDPAGLVTYVNFPSTEYLDLPFVDFVAFNVYLEDEEKLDSYLARLQNLAGDRPLVMAEVGLDSRRNGELAQALALKWQLRTAFAAGCAGVFVFAWTDEWHRGGFDVEDWDFGLTDRDRLPKPALTTVSEVFAAVPVPSDLAWPRMSVVVCSYNGSRTIRDCLDGLRLLEYPDYEVIVVDDGSTDDTAAIAREYGFRVISTDNLGLSSARNTGLAAASGEIVAYTDDDARPNPHWLTYLAIAFQQGDYAGVGGPNIPPPDDGPIAECVAKAPGGPIHVLLSDREAEHIPGCNMAFRADALRAVGGFDSHFRVAGDDVDVCWRIRERGWRLGFSPAAMVWHHRRNSVRAYWKQQRGYGKAEALLERKWPEKYNGVGHATWAGRLYAPTASQLLGWKSARVYHGTWGSAPFQSVDEPASFGLGALVAMPEWYLMQGIFAVLGALGMLWPPLFLGLALAILGVAASVVHAERQVAHIWFGGTTRSRRERLPLRLLTFALHLVQPLARLLGRFQWGLKPWRRRSHVRLAPPLPRTATLWSEEWRVPEDWLAELERALRSKGNVVVRGGAHDRWDLETGRGSLARARLRVVVEEHGGGRQLVRLRSWPRWMVMSTGLPLALLGLVAAAALDRAWAVALPGFLLAVGIAAWAALDGAGATATAQLALATVDRELPEQPSEAPASTTERTGHTDGDVAQALSSRALLPVAQSCGIIVGTTDDRRRAVAASGDGRARPRSAEPAMSDQTIRRLNWGCGKRGEPGWINSDQKDGPGIDLSCDIRQGLPLESDSIDYCVSIHALPEVPYPELAPVLQELRRVIKPGGVLRLVLPDLLKAVEAYQRGDVDHFLIPDEDAQKPGAKLVLQLIWYGYSRTLFTHDFVEELLVKAGFSRVERCGFQQTTSSYPDIVALDNREQESLFVEAIR